MSGNEGISSTAASYWSKTLLTHHSCKIVSLKKKTEYVAQPLPWNEYCSITCDMARSLHDVGEVCRVILWRLRGSLVNSQ